MPPMKRDLVEVLRHAIKTSGKSRPELEHESGVTMAVIGRFVGGKRSITIDTAAKLAGALGLVLVPDEKAVKPGR